MLRPVGRRTRLTFAATAVPLLLLTACGGEDPSAAPDPASLVTMDEAALSAAAEAARTGPDGPEDGGDGSEDPASTSSPDPTGETTDGAGTTDAEGDGASGAFTPRLLDPSLLEDADVVVPLTEDQVVVGPSDPDITGYGEAVLSFTRDRVAIVVVVEVADGDTPIGAGVYRGEPGIDGPPVLDLGPFAPGSPLGQAVWVLEQDVPFLADSWRSGDLSSFYVEVVTTAGPSGLARGQLGS